MARKAHPTRRQGERNLFSATWLGGHAAECGRIAADAWQNAANTCRQAGDAAESRQNLRPPQRRLQRFCRWSAAVPPLHFLFSLSRASIGRPRSIAALCLSLRRRGVYPSPATSPFVQVREGARVKSN